MIDLSGGVFKIDKSSAARQQIGLHINDNVYRNIDKFNARSFETGKKFSLTPLTQEEKLEVVKDLVDDADLAK